MFANFRAIGLNKVDILSSRSVALCFPLTTAKNNVFNSIDCVAMFNFDILKFLKAEIRNFLLSYLP